MKDEGINLGDHAGKKETAVRFSFVPMPIPI